MFTVTEHDTKVRREARRLKDEIKGNHEPGSSSTEELLLTKSFTEVLERRIKLLLLLYRKDDEDPSVWVTVSQRAVLEALDHANIRPDGVDGFHRLASLHLSSEFVIWGIRYNFAGGGNPSAFTLPGHRYTSFNIKMNFAAIPDDENPPD